jgi:membrane-associated phospholipid phosphatase
MPFPRGPVDRGNPYRPISPPATFPPQPRQEGFGTLGDPNILALIGEVTTRALKACWFQKWFVHRRLRPEEFRGLIHKHLTGVRLYPINGEILRTGGGANPTVLDQVNGRFGSFLLPQVYPEASPLHPSYPSGHATIAGACVTILKV